MTGDDTEMSIRRSVVAKSEGSDLDGIRSCRCFSEQFRTVGMDTDEPKRSAPPKAS